MCAALALFPEMALFGGIYPFFLLSSLKGERVPFLLSFKGPVCLAQDVGHSRSRVCSGHFILGKLTGQTMQKKRNKLFFWFQINACFLTLPEFKWSSV